MKILKTNNNIEFEVDDDDFELLSKFKWNITSTGYIQTTIFAHRLVMGMPSGKIVDHKDLNPLNNQKSNLRVCNHSENTINRPPSKRKFRGVRTPDERNPNWRCGIGKNRKHFTIGTFPTEHLAALAYDLWAVDLHGEFVRPNFPIVSHN